MATEPGTIARRAVIVGSDNPAFQVSSDEWNAPLIISSAAPDGSLLVRDRTQPDGWGLAPEVPAFVGVPPSRKVNNHPLVTDVWVTAADVGLGNVENTKLSTWGGSEAIATVGTITTGTWQGSVIQAPYGGTGSPFVKFTGPTALRTYTLPDQDAILFTSSDTIPPANGGTGVTTGLTQLNASNLTSGIVPDERLSGNVARTNVPNNIPWNAVNKAGSSLADLEVRSASDLNSGTLPIARLPPEVVLGPLTAGSLPNHHANHERFGIDAIKLDDLAEPDDNADLDSSATRHGLLPRLAGNPSVVLNGIGQWVSGLSIGPGTGDVVGPAGATADAIALFLGTSGKVIKDSTVLMSSVVLTTDPRLSDARTPTAHRLTHEPGGSDPMTVDAAAATGSLRTLGTGPLQATAGNDARLTNARTPTAHAPTHQPGGSDPMAVDAVAATGSLRTLGTGPLQAAPGNDTRFTDARTPTAHRVTHETGGTDALTALSAAILTTGTLADARLSTNVPLKNAANVFTADQELTNAGGIRLLLRDTSQAVDARLWRVMTSSLVLRVQANSDAGALQNECFMDRAGVWTANAGLGTTPLNATNLTTGTIPDARFSANVARRDQSNIFVGDILISKTLPRLALLYSGTARSRLFALTEGDVRISRNVDYDGANYLLDNTALTGSHLALNTLGNLVFASYTAGANPRIGTAVLQVDHLTGNTTHIGDVTISKTSGQLFIADNAQAADAKLFRIVNSGGSLIFQGINDALTIGTPNMALNRLGVLTLGAGQIVFPTTANPSSGTTTLDDYREGNWTPSLTCTGGGTVTLSAPTNSGVFIKVGRLVIAQVTMTISAVSAPTGVLQLGGLPATAAATVAVSSIMPVGLAAAGGVDNVIAHSIAGGSGLNIYVVSGGTVINITPYLSSSTVLYCSFVYVSQN